MCGKVKFKGAIIGCCLLIILFTQMWYLTGHFSPSVSFQGDSVTLCNMVAPTTQSKLNITTTISLEEATKLLGNAVSLGGSHEPQGCKSRWKLAIIVPFRDRDQHLGPFHYHLHSFLQRQHLSYSIFLVNQTDKKPFNRAKLFNVGFNEIKKLDSFDCFIFHDVDFIPDDDRNMYYCTPMPRHLTVNYAHPYGSAKDFTNKYFGGVVMLTQEHIELLNGWSNRFWGWGGEDDDLKKRIDMKELPIWRYPRSIGTYKMLPHKGGAKNPERYKLLKTTNTVATKDGLNSLEYKLLKIKRWPLFTSFDIDFS